MKTENKKPSAQKKKAKETAIEKMARLSKSNPVVSGQVTEQLFINALLNNGYLLNAYELAENLGVSVTQVKNFARGFGLNRNKVKTGESNGYAIINGEVVKYVHQSVKTDNKVAYELQK